jgi:signal recognition particle receptor subunit alpha
LQQQNLKVLIAACDTFRAGAIEQLQVHARNLGVPVYHQGYGKDAASIAREGISQAQKQGMDVVLVDTAGRMQDNEPLMQALAKVIKVNNPDLILFVGEALVGNDSVDQLTKFNRYVNVPVCAETHCPCLQELLSFPFCRSLEEYGDVARPRVVDGIFLTKFDTVDDKVGAAISMVYTTGQPIVFIGVGQNYSDIRTLNTKRIVNILFKGRV